VPSYANSKFIYSTDFHFRAKDHRITDYQINSGSVIAGLTRNPGKDAAQAVCEEQWNNHRTTRDGCGAA
jgi:hypothetical protein